MKKSLVWATNAKTIFAAPIRNKETAMEIDNTFVTTLGSIIAYVRVKHQPQLVRIHILM